MAIANIPDVTSIPFVTTLSRFVVNPPTDQPVIVNGQPVPLIGPNGPLAGRRPRAAHGASRARPGPRHPGGARRQRPAAVRRRGALRQRGRHHQRPGRRLQRHHPRRGQRGGRGLRRRQRRCSPSLATHGINVGGITYTRAFLTGGVFSYDGVHPTPSATPTSPTSSSTRSTTSSAARSRRSTSSPSSSAHGASDGCGGGADLDGSEAGFRHVRLHPRRWAQPAAAARRPKWMVDGTPAPKPTKPRRPRHGKGYEASQATGARPGCAPSSPLPRQLRNEKFLRPLSRFSARKHL